jgi:hypothetical protein
VVRQGGALNRISGSDEVNRDREAAVREGGRIPANGQGQGQGRGRSREDAGQAGARGAPPVVQPPGAVPGEEGLVPEEPPAEPSPDEQGFEPPVEEEPVPDADADPAQPPEPEGAQGGDDQEPDGPVMPAGVRLVPAQSTYRVGDAIVVNVVIENGQNVGSVPFHLRYDPAVVQFAPPATVGPFLGSDGSQPVFLASDVAGGGEVVVGLSRLGGGEGISGSGVLATFQFMAAGPGNAGFAFSGASVKDPMARNLPATFGVVSVQVAP